MQLQVHRTQSNQHQWAVDWQLGVFIDKCCVMCIGKGEITDLKSCRRVVTLVAFNFLLCLRVAIWVLQSETFHLVIILLI